MALDPILPNSMVFAKVFDAYLFYLPSISPTLGSQGEKHGSTGHAEQGAKLLQITLANTDSYIGIQQYAWMPSKHWEEALIHISSTFLPSHMEWVTASVSPWSPYL